MDFITNAYTILSVILFTNVEYLVQSTNMLMNEIQNIDYTTILTKLFLIYIDTKTRVSKCGNYLYNNFDVVKNTVDTSSYNYERIKAMYNDHRIEPFDNNWVCISILLKNDETLFTGNQQIYIENYQHIKPHTTPDVSKHEYYNNCLSYFGKIAASIAKSNNNVIETMVTMKLDDRTAYHSFNKSTDEPTYSNTRSKASFLTIEYTHPKMKNRISMELEQDLYFTNNVILSSLFIKRYLEYQTEKFIFDENYTINLMDNTINMITLTYSQSILLSEDSYTIIKNE
jgi:hypothetical protein